MIKAEELIRKAFKIPFQVILNSDVNNFLSAINSKKMILDCEEKIVNYNSLIPIHDFILSPKPLNTMKKLSNQQKQNLFRDKKSYSPMCSSDLENAIIKSDVIIYGPGTLYSSLYPSLITKKISKINFKF